MGPGRSDGLYKMFYIHHRQRDLDDALLHMNDAIKYTIILAIMSARCQSGVVAAATAAAI